jgi:hypothetical protein
MQTTDQGVNWESYSDPTAIRPVNRMDIDPTRPGAECAIVGVGNVGNPDIF